jgi:hypothetical protein
MQQPKMKMDRHETSKGYSMIFESLIFFTIYDFPKNSIKKTFKVHKINLQKWTFLSSLVNYFSRMYISIHMI